MDGKTVIETAALKKISYYLFPALTIFFILLLLVNKQLYLSVLKEDNVVEWLTFTCLLCSGIISLCIAVKIKTQHDYLHWFFILFFAFNVFAGLEEISYGQRVFDIETTGIFAKHSDQNEINLHNTLQGMFKMKTKHLALLTLFVYGVNLPWLIRKGKLSIRCIMERKFIVPPSFLIIGFGLGTLMMLDFITGSEEEVGEFLYSVCFLVFMLYNYSLSKSTLYFKRQPTSVIETEHPLLKHSKKELFS